MNTQDASAVWDAWLLLMLALVVLCLICSVIRRGYRYYRDNKPMATRLPAPKPDSRSSIVQFRNIHRP